MAEFIAVALMLLLAAGLRLGHPGIAEFKGDEAHIAEMALDIAQGRSFPLHGITTSVGLPKPPISIYVYVLPFLFSSNPLAGVLFTAALNVLGVALCWWVGRRYWGKVAGLCAGLLFATSPWAVLFSRKIWESNLMSPFVLAYIASGLLGFLEGRPWAQALHFVLLALTVQLHYHGLLVAPLTVLFLLVGRRRIRWPAIGIGTACALVTALPFLVYLMSQGQETVRLFADFLSQPARISADSCRFWWLIVTGSDVHSLAGPLAYRDFLARLPPLAPLHVAVGVLALGGVLLGLWAGLRRPRGLDQAAAGVVALWAVLPSLLTIRHSSPLFLHYFTILFPAPYLATGFLLSRLASLRGTGWRPAVLAGTTAVALAQAGVYLALLSFVGSQATPGGFGVPLQILLQARDRALASGGPIAVIGPGDDPLGGIWVSVYDVLLRGTPHRFVDGTQAALLPGRPSTLLLAPGSETAKAIYAELGLISSEARIPARIGEEPFYVIRWQPGPAPEWTEISGYRALENGAEFISYRLDGELRPGNAAEWWITWRVWKPPPDPSVRYHLFNHLLDATGRQWAQADGAAVWTRDWDIGDLVSQRFRLTVPDEAGPGPYFMRVGMYTYPELKGISVLDIAANPAGHWLSLGPFP